MNQLRRDWNDAFFAMKPATPLGLFRIAFGLIVFTWCLLLIPDLRTWFSEQGLFTLAAMRAFGMDNLGFSLLRNVTDFRITEAAFVLLMAAAAMLCAGYKTRLASIVVFVLLTSFHHRDLIIMNGGDTLQRNLAFLLIFADSGAACSVDRLIRIGRGEELASDTPMIEVWPLRLLQLQIAAVYISTVGSKVSGSHWPSGDALYYALHLTDLRRFSLFGLENQRWFFSFLTFATLAIEFSLGALVWVPRLRGYVLLMGVLLHGGIEYTMIVPLFSYTMMASYLTFVYPHWVEGWADWLGERLRRSRIEVPGSLEPTGRGGELLHALDPLRLVRSSSTMSTDFVTSAYIRRVLLRFPITWAVILGPPGLLFAVMPDYHKLAFLEIAWATAGLFAVRALSHRIFASLPGDGAVAIPAERPEGGARPAPYHDLEFDSPETHVPPKNIGAIQ